MTTAAEPVPSADEAFGLVVHEAMFRQRISQTKLATALGITQSALSKKLHGDRPWTLVDAIAIADALRLDLRDLLGQMWRDGTPNEGAQWALRGSNPQPTDYYVAGSQGADIVDLASRRVARGALVSKSA